MSMSESDVDVDKLLTLREAAKYSGYTYGYLRQLVAEGQAKTTRRGNMHFVTRKEAERLRRRRSQNM